MRCVCLILITARIILIARPIYLSLLHRLFLTVSQEDERCPVCNQVIPNVPDHINNVHGIDINLKVDITTAR
jgi:hypothetical protein